MTKQAPLLGIKPGVSSWPAALIGMVVIKAVLSLAVAPGAFVVSYSGISFVLLLILATLFAIRNAIRNTLGGGLFWALLATAFGIWMAQEGIQVYYELGLHIAVPNDSIADSLLFVHIALLMAAVATLPHRDAPDRKPYVPILNGLLVVFFWIFLYGYAVFPYQYLSSAAAPFTYALRFDLLYLCGNVALIAMVASLFPRAKDPWKSIYFNLLGAASLYALTARGASLDS